MVEQGITVYPEALRAITKDMEEHDGTGLFDMRSGLGYVVAVYRYGSDKNNRFTNWRKIVINRSGLIVESEDRPINELSPTLE